jgi:hypothetical protein
MNIYIVGTEIDFCVADHANRQVVNLEICTEWLGYVPNYNGGQA